MKNHRIVLALIAAAATACSDRANINPTAPSAPTAAIATAASPEALQGLLEAELARIESQQHAFPSGLAEISANRVEDPKSVAKLLKCDPLTYAGEAKTIGPDGGVLMIGPHRLQIPRGALNSYVVISGELVPSLLVQVRFSPHGLKFAIPAQLTLNYSHCKRLSDLVERVAYIDSAEQILEWPASREGAGNTVTAWIGHFSSYAVAY